MKSADQKFWDRKSRKCSSKLSLKIQKNERKKRSRKFSFSHNFQENFRWKFSRFFDLKNFGRPISKCSNFFHNKPFWSRFFQSCVDYQGGYDGSCFRGATQLYPSWWGTRKSRLLPISARPWNVQGFFEGLDWRLRSLSKYSIFINEILISGLSTPNVCLSCIKELSYQFFIREKLIEKFLAHASSRTRGPEQVFKQLASDIALLGERVKNQNFLTWSQTSQKIIYSSATQHS